MRGKGGREEEKTRNAVDKKMQKTKTKGGGVVEI